MLLWLLLVVLSALACAIGTEAQCPPGNLAINLPPTTNAPTLRFVCVSTSTAAVTAIAGSGSVSAPSDTLVVRNVSLSFEVDAPLILGSSRGNISSSSSSTSTSATAGPPVCTVVTVNNTINSTTTSVCITRHLLCGNSTFRQRKAPVELLVEDCFEPASIGSSSSVSWTTTVSAPAVAAPFTALLSDRFHVVGADNTSARSYQLWTGAAHNTPVSSSFNPFEPLPWADLDGRVPYGCTAVQLPKHPSRRRSSSAQHEGNPPLERSPSPLPLFAVLDNATDTAVVLLQALSNQPIDADLTVDSAQQALAWNRRWSRLGGGTPAVQLKRRLGWTHADWRSVLGLFVQAEETGMRMNAGVNASRLWGGGSYMDYRGEGDGRVWPTRLAPMLPRLVRQGYQLNWEVSANWGPSHGLWLPFNLSTGAPYAGNWTSCFGQVNYTAYYGGNSPYQYVEECWSLNYDALNAWQQDLQALGFAGLMYANWWEYGWNVTRTDQPLPAACAGGGGDVQNQDLAFCSTNTYLRERLSHAPIRRWTDAGGADEGSVIAAGMQGSVILDAGVPEYQQHLLQMARWVLQRVPAAEGLVFDRTGFASLVNVQADDGRSFVEYHGGESGVFGGPVERGRAVRTQVVSQFEALQAVAEVMHGGGKAVFWNPQLFRADSQTLVDGMFSEIGWEASTQMLMSLLGAGGKPGIAWIPGCNGPLPAKFPMAQCAAGQKQPGGWDTAVLLQRLLFFGLQPMIPTPRNDHGITPRLADAAGDSAVFDAFGPLFRQMRLVRMELGRPRAAEIVRGQGQVAFYRRMDMDDPWRLVLPVVFGSVPGENGSGATVRFTVDRTEKVGRAAVVVAGSETGVPEGVVVRPVGGGGEGNTTFEVDIAFTAGYPAAVLLVECENNIL